MTTTAQLTEELNRPLPARTPNQAVGLTPLDLPCTPPEIRDASDALDAARRRYFGLEEELGEAHEAMTTAQAADVAAARTAVASGKTTPKPKAQAAAERAARMERDLEAARTNAVAAEDHYLNTWRAHRAQWLASFGAERELMADRVERAKDELRRGILDLANADVAFREIEQLGDPAKIKHPNKANTYAILNFRRINRLDQDDERRIAAVAQ
jgi:hypothetical protein